MPHVHGGRVEAQTEILRRARLDQLVAVAVDTAKDSAVVQVADFTGQLLCRPFEIAQTRPGLEEFVDRVQAATDGIDLELVRVGPPCAHRCTAARSASSPAGAPRASSTAPPG